MLSSHHCGIPTTPPPHTLPQPEQNLSGLPPLLPTHHQGMAGVPQLQQQSLRLSINPSKQALLLCPFSAAHHPRSGTPFNSFPTANSSLATEHSSAQPNHMGNERMVLASECSGPAIHSQFALEGPPPSPASALQSSNCSLAKWQQKRSGQQLKQIRISPTT